MLPDHSATPKQYEKLAVRWQHTLRGDSCVLPIRAYRQWKPARSESPPLGLELTVTLSSETAGGALTVIETVNAPGFGPPLHRHHETEVFRVLEGRYLFEVNGRRLEAAAGDTVSVPGGDAHAFVNITEKPARQLIMILPAMDAARFFTELGEFFKGKPDRDALNVFGKPWGVEFLGPPLSPGAR